VVSVFLSRYLPAVATNAVGANGRLHIVGIPIAPGSLFTYVASFCAFVLVVVMPVVGRCRPVRAYAGDAADVRVPGCRVVCGDVVHHGSNWGLGVA